MTDGGRARACYFKNGGLLGINAHLERAAQGVRVGREAGVVVGRRRRRRQRRARPARLALALGAARGLTARGGGGAGTRRLAGLVVKVVPQHGRAPLLAGGNRLRQQARAGVLWPAGRSRLEQLVRAAEVRPTRAARAVGPAASAAQRRAAGELVGARDASTTARAPRRRRCRRDDAQPRRTGCDRAGAPHWERARDNGGRRQGGRRLTELIFRYRTVNFRTRPSRACVHRPSPFVFTALRTRALF